MNARLLLPCAMSLAVSLMSCAPAAPAASPPTPRAAADASFPSPLEQADYRRLTSHSELLAYMDELAAASDLVTRRTLGQSVEGREIPYVEIADGAFGADERKLRLLLFAQQHGNEPSGKEAALELLRSFAEGRETELLNGLDILLVPSVNPDGGESHERRNAENVDLNRSHLVLNGHESRLLRDLFHEWEPEITLDIHEYRPFVESWQRHGVVRIFDEQFGVPTSLNVPAPIRELALEAFIPFADRYLGAHGFTHHEYLVGNPEYIRYSTTDINDGRQSFGVLGTFSLILEGKNGRTPTENLRRRVAGQVTALNALLTFADRNADDIRSAVSRARRELREGSPVEFALTMDRASTGSALRIPALAVEPSGGATGYVPGDTVIAEIEAYFPDVVAERTILLPEAYLIPADRGELIALFEAHRVEMEAATAEDELRVERLTIEGFETVERKGGEASHPVVSSETLSYEPGPGDVLVPTAQLHGVMVATALEPESMHALLWYEEFADMRAEGVYPVLRVVREADVGES